MAFAVSIVTHTCATLYQLYFRQFPLVLQTTLRWLRLPWRYCLYLPGPHARTLCPRPRCEALYTQPYPVLSNLVVTAIILLLLLCRTRVGTGQDKQTGTWDREDRMEELLPPPSSGFALHDLTIVPPPATCCLPFYHHLT